MIFKIIAFGIVVLLLVMCYALMVTAKRADERAERMYEKWRQRRDEIDRR